MICITNKLYKVLHINSLLLNLQFSVLYFVDRCLSTTHCHLSVFSFRSLSSIIYYSCQTTQQIVNDLRNCFSLNSNILHSLEKNVFENIILFNIRAYIRIRIFGLLTQISKIVFIYCDSQFNLFRWRPSYPRSQVFGFMRIGKNKILIVNKVISKQTYNFMLFFLKTHFSKLLDKYFI